MTPAPGVGGTHGVALQVPLPLLLGGAGMQEPSVSEQSRQHARAAQLPRGRERVLGVRGESFWVAGFLNGTRPRPHGRYVLASPEATTDVVGSSKGLGRMGTCWASGPTPGPTSPALLTAVAHVGHWFRHCLYHTTDHTAFWLKRDF